MSSQCVSWSSSTTMNTVPLENTASSGVSRRTRPESSSERSSEENSCWRSHSLHRSPLLQLPLVAWLRTVWTWGSQIRWFNLIVVVATPLMSLYGAYTTTLKTNTFIFCILCYLINMIGTWITLLSYSNSPRLTNAILVHL